MLISSHLSWGLRLSLSPAGAAISPGGQGSILSPVPAAVPSLMTSSACLSPQLTLPCRLIRLHTLRNAAAKGMLQSHRHAIPAQGDFSVCVCVSPHRHTRSCSHPCAGTRTHVCLDTHTRVPAAPTPCSPTPPADCSDRRQWKLVQGKRVELLSPDWGFARFHPSYAHPGSGAAWGRTLPRECRCPPLQPEDVRAQRPRLAHRPCPRALGLRPGGQQVTESELRPGRG